jgi:Family of unknown function (DUF5906)
MEQVQTIDRTTPEKTNEIRMELHHSDIVGMDATTLENFISQLEDHMCLNVKGDRYVPWVNGAQIFGFEDGQIQNVNIDSIGLQRRNFITVLSDAYHRAGELGIRDEASVDVTGNEFRLGQRITRLIETVDDTYEMIFRWVRTYERINHPTYVPIKGDMETQIFRCQTMSSFTDAEKEDTSSFQKFLLYLLDQAYKLKLRRYGDYCCKQIATEEGHLTKAWKPVMEIKDFVYYYSQKEEKYDMWKHMTSKGSIVTDTIRHLTNCRDLQFPSIKKNRNVWSFRNGIFVGKFWDDKESAYGTRFYEYTSENFKHLDPTIVSSKYFDLPFDPEILDLEDWYTIPTPHMQSVLDYQGFSKDVCKWIYVFCGRLCFEVNDMDSWQVIPFLKGIARSGKSTIITKVCKKFYEGQDVRTLSNNIEKKFGLESIHDGLMFISPEIKGDMALEQAEFQSLVSGEDMSIARKNKTALSLTWRVPGILAGNEVPNWKDNSGSVLRRLVTWNFGRQVAEADPHLDSKLDSEMANILCKCVRAYLEYAQRYSDQDIWNVLPKYFLDIQNQVAMVTNTLQHFLASEKVVYGSHLCCPQKMFVSAFNQHCQENNLGRPRFNPDFYAGPFSSRQLEVRPGTQWRDQTLANQPFIWGMDLAQDLNTVI